MIDATNWERIDEEGGPANAANWEPVKREGKLFADIADVAVRGASMGILRGGDLPFIGKDIEESRTPDEQKGLGRKALEFAGEVGAGFLVLAPLGIFRLLTGASIAAASKLAPLFGVTGRRATAALGEAAIGAGLATAQMGGEAVRKGELPSPGEAALQVGTGAALGGALGAAFPPKLPTAAPTAAALPEAPLSVAPMGDVLQPTLTPAPPGAGVGAPLPGLELPEAFQGMAETIRMPQYQSVQDALALMQQDVQQRARAAAAGAPPGAMAAERPLVFQQPSERPGVGISPIQELAQGPPAVGERGRPLPPEPPAAPAPPPTVPQPPKPRVGEAVLPELREDKFMRAAQARQAEILNEGDILDPTEALTVALKELQSEPLVLKRVLDSLKKADTTFTDTERRLYEQLRSTEFEKDLEAQLRQGLGGEERVAQASIFRQAQPRVIPPAIEYLQEVLQQHGDLRDAVKEAFGAGFDKTGTEEARAALARYGIEYLGGGAYGSAFRIGNSAVKLLYDVKVGAREAAQEAKALKVLENVRGIPALGGTAMIPAELLNGQYPMAALAERVVGELVPRRTLEPGTAWAHDVQVITRDHVTDLIRLGQDIARRGVLLYDWHPGNVLFSNYKGHSLANRIDFGMAELGRPAQEALEQTKVNLLSMGEIYGLEFVAAHGGRPPAALPQTAPWQQRVLNYFGFC